MKTNRLWLIPGGWLMRHWAQSGTAQALNRLDDRLMPLFERTAAFRGLYLGTRRLVATGPIYNPNLPNAVVFPRDTPTLEELGLSKEQVEAERQAEARDSETPLPNR